MAKAKFKDEFQFPDEVDNQVEDDIEIEKIKAGFDTTTPSSGGPELFGAIKNFDPALLKSMMYNMALIESIFGGLTVGKISSGNYISGIKHVIMMLIITVVSFTLVG